MHSLVWVEVGAAVGTIDLVSISLSKFSSPDCRGENPGPGEGLFTVVIGSEEARMALTMDGQANLPLCPGGLLKSKAVRTP